MEINEFIELGIGQWFSLRTSYHLDDNKTDNSKSDITIERLSVDHPEVVNLCQQRKIDPTITLGGTKISWDTSVDWGKTKQVGSSLMILIPDGDNLQMGQLLHRRHLQQTVISGRYILGNDEALTLITEEGKNYSEERLWFASPNLRLRTSLLKNSNGFSATTFYSEIRRMPPKTD